MRVRVEDAGVVGGYGVDMLVMGFFTAVGEDLVVGENVVLGVAADPGTVRLELEMMLLRRGLEVFIPNGAEMGLHHPLFGLAYGKVEAFGFAVALGEGWLRTYGAVGIHDHFGWSGGMWFGRSGFVCFGWPGGIWFINGCFHSLG